MLPSRDMDSNEKEDGMRVTNEDLATMVQELQDGVTIHWTWPSREDLGKDLLESRAEAAALKAERDALAAQVVQIKEALDQALAVPESPSQWQKTKQSCAAALALTPTVAEEQAKEWREKASKCR